MSSSTYHFASHPLSENPRAANFLMQEKMWVNANLERVRIKDMDLDYVVSTMIWLLKRAPEVKFQLELYYRSKDAGPEVFDPSQEPYSWMKSTPLFLRLMARFDKLSTTYPPKPKIMNAADSLYEEYLHEKTYG